MISGAPFHHGDHVCAMYMSAEEQETVAARFIAEGLSVGERCLFAGASTAALARFRDRLRGEGIHAATEEHRRALLLLTKEQAHLVDGCFDSERMLRMLNQAVEDALNDGFAGLRTCGDMSWLLDDAAGASQVVEYEALVTELFKTVRGLAMCQYDRSLLPPEIIDHALATHRTIVMDGAHATNPFAIPPSVAARRAAHPEDVPWKLAELRKRAVRGLAFQIISSDLTLQAQTRAPLVLVVEDHADTRHMVEEYLQFHGIGVVTAENGLAGLAALREHRPCMILLDLSMPVMDGWQFRQEQEKLPDEHLARTPFVVLSALTDAARHAEKLGAADVIPKPIDFDRLVAVVRRHLTTLNLRETPG